MKVPALHIRLFGLLELTWDDRPLAAPRSTRTHSLLAYLIVHRDRPFARDVLGGTFWPDRPEDLTRRALSNALWQIRQSLDPAADRLVTERETVTFRLHPDDQLDVATFERTVQRCTGPQAPNLPACLDALEKGIALYRGDLLEDCYDDWVLVERERLRELHLTALEQLIHLHKQSQAYKRALTYAQRLAAADPLREAAHRELMRLYHFLGRDRAALQQYAILHRLLEEELGVAPTAVTAGLYHEIATAMASPAPVHLPQAPPPIDLRDLSHLPLVGRDQERAQLLTAVQAATHGHGGAILLEGEAGVGKTRLATEVAAGARWRGLQVGLGQAAPNAPLYRPLVDALAPLLTLLRVSQLATLVEPRQLSALLPLLPTLADHAPDLPELPTLAPEQAQERLYEGLSHCLAGLTATAPLLLILEDLHQADGATLTALLSLVPRLRSSRVLFLLTYRTVEARQRAEVWETLDQLDRIVPLQRLCLSPFDFEQTSNLLGRALGVPAEQARSLAEPLWTETHGNALFLIETLKTLIEQGSPDDERQEKSARAGPALVSSLAKALQTVQSVQSVIQQRLARLDPGPRKMLDLIAVLGSEVDFTLLFHASNLTPTDSAQPASKQAKALIDKLGILCQRGFLLEGETGYRFEHDQVRQVVYQAIPVRRRQKLHRRAGVTLEALHPEQVERLAHHFAQGQVKNKALHYTLGAGAKAQALYDSRSALAHYRQALELAGDDPALRWETLSRQEEALDLLGRREEQTAVLNDMLNLAQTLDDPARQAHAYHRWGWQEVLAGDPVRALDLLDDAVRLARVAGERDLLANCLASAARAWWRRGDIPRCQAAVEEARDLFQQTGDRRGEMRALNMLGNINLALTGNYGQALAYFEKTRQIARQLGDLYGEASAQGNLGITCTALGQYRRSQQALAEAFQAMAQIDHRNWQGIILHWQGVNCHAQGDLARARALAQEALDTCREVGNRNFEIETLGLLGQVALDQGKPEQARRLFEHAVEVAQTNQQKMDWVEQLSRLALAHAHLGDIKEAQRLSEQAVETLESLGERLSRMSEVYFERYQIVTAAQGPKAARPYLEKAHQNLLAMADEIRDPDLRRSFLENVPVNRAILTAHRQDRPPAPLQRQTARLPRADAPTGRPLRDDEWVTVTWDTSRPEDAEVTGRAERRRRRLLRLLDQAADQAAAPTVADLATALDVSARTIKRDLAALRAAGHAAPTRGSQ